MGNEPSRDIPPRVVYAPVVHVGGEVWQTAVPENVGGQVWQTSVPQNVGGQVWQMSVLQNVNGEVSQTSVPQNVGGEVSQTSVPQNVGGEVSQTSENVDRKMWPNSIDGEVWQSPRFPRSGGEPCDTGTLIEHQACARNYVQKWTEQGWLQPTGVMEPSPPPMKPGTSTPVGGPGPRRPGTPSRPVSPSTRASPRRPVSPKRTVSPPRAPPKRPKSPPRPQVVVAQGPISVPQQPKVTRPVITGVPQVAPLQVTRPPPTAEMQQEMDKQDYSNYHTAQDKYMTRHRQLTDPGQIEASRRQIDLIQNEARRSKNWGQGASRYRELLAAPAPNLPPGRPRASTFSKPQTDESQLEDFYKRHESEMKRIEQMPEDLNKFESMKRLMSKLPEGPLKTKMISGLNEQYGHLKSVSAQPSNDESARNIIAMPDGPAKFSALQALIEKTPDGPKREELRTIYGEGIAYYTYQQSLSQPNPPPPPLAPPSEVPTAPEAPPAPDAPPPPVSGEFAGKTRVVAQSDGKSDLLASIRKGKALKKVDKSDRSTPSRPSAPTRPSTSGRSASPVTAADLQSTAKGLRKPSPQQPSVKPKTGVEGSLSSAQARLSPEAKAKIAQAEKDEVDRINRRNAINGDDWDERDSGGDGSSRRHKRSSERKHQVARSSRKKGGEHEHHSRRIHSLLSKETGIKLSASSARRHLEKVLVKSSKKMIRRGGAGIQPVPPKAFSWYMFTPMSRLK